MSRAGYDYVAPEWDTLLSETGLTQLDVATAIGVSERHIANILSGETKRARFRTAKKIKDGLKQRGIGQAKIEKLIIKADRVNVYSNGKPKA